MNFGVFSNFYKASRKENRRVWQIIRSCCETDGETAYQILISSGLYCLDNCIRNVVDQQGNVYNVPNFLINDPVYIKEFEKEKKDKVKEEKYDVKLVINEDNACRRVQQQGIQAKSAKHEHREGLAQHIREVDQAGPF